MSEFATNLRYFRKVRGWTQQELADKIGTSYMAVSNYERGIRTPDYPTLEALADIFNVSIDRLFGKEETFDELDGFLEYLKNREEGRLLFSKLRGASVDEIKQAAAIIDALRKSKNE